MDGHSRRFEDILLAIEYLKGKEEQSSVYDH